MIIFGIDFDGTCVTNKYPSMGEDIGAAQVLKKLANKGHLLVLNTMRDKEELEYAKKWFSDNNLPLHGVQCTPGQTWTTSTKVYAHIYIDDAALGCPIKNDRERKYVDWIKVEQILIRQGIL